MGFKQVMEKEKWVVRDEVLAAQKIRRAYLVSIATKIAIKIASADGAVSSPKVWKALYARARRSKNFSAILHDADPRWMGIVFASGDWMRLRWETGNKILPKASHNRPVSVWVYRRPRPSERA